MGVAWKSIFLVAIFCVSLVVSQNQPEISSSYSTDVVIQRFNSYTVNQSMFVDGQSLQIRFEEADNTTIEIADSTNNIGVRFVPSNGDCYTTCFKSQRCPPDPYHQCEIQWPIVDWFVPLVNATFTGYCTNGILWESIAEQNNIVYQLTYCVSNNSEPLYILFSVGGKAVASVEFYNWEVGVPDASLFQIPAGCPCTNNNVLDSPQPTLPERNFVTTVFELINEFTDLYTN
eukprot:Phypoly_transcript_12181.p1 GENE.Phypoly_transcript_12181~~Phypoly_transcript_12181.p1  ORF type:complete len:231 (+),score=26.96 Phypoly_transcript_12181:116-808(+)